MIDDRGAATIDLNVELAVRQARARAAVEDPNRTTTTCIAALAAGASAKLVARQHRAREVLIERIGKSTAAAKRRRHADPS